MQTRCFGARKETNGKVNGKAPEKRRGCVNFPLPILRNCDMHFSAQSLIFHFVNVSWDDCVKSVNKRQHAE